MGLYINSLNYKLQCAFSTVIIGSKVLPVLFKRMNKFGMINICKIRGNGVNLQLKLRISCLK